MRERSHEFLVLDAPALGGAGLAASPDLGVGQRLFLGPSDRLRLGEDPLPFIALAGSGPAHDHGAELGVFAGPTSDRRVAAGQELQVVEVGTLQAQGFFLLQPQEVALEQLRAALVALARPDQPEDDDPVVAPAPGAVVLRFLAHSSP
jgi:hypothetical protein